MLKSYKGWKALCSRYVQLPFLCLSDKLCFIKDWRDESHGHDGKQTVSHYVPTGLLQLAHSETHFHKTCKINSTHSHVKSIFASLVFLRQENKAGTKTRIVFPPSKWFLRYLSWNVSDNVFLCFCEAISILLAIFKQPLVSHQWIVKLAVSFQAPAMLAHSKSLSLLKCLFLIVHKS